MNDFLAAVIDGYLRAVEWIGENPAKTLWFATIAIAFFAVM
jgi:hypothetical protein